MDHRQRFRLAFDLCDGIDTHVKFPGNLAQAVSSFHNIDDISILKIFRREGLYRRALGMLLRGRDQFLPALGDFDDVRSCWQGC